MERSLSSRGKGPVESRNGACLVPTQATEDPKRDGPGPVTERCLGESRSGALSGHGMEPCLVIERSLSSRGSGPGLITERGLALFSHGTGPCLVTERSRV